MPRMNADKRRWLKNSSVLFSIVILVGALLSIQPVTTTGEEPNTITSKPLVVLTGPNSKIERASAFRVTSTEKIEQIWREHIGRGQDFDEYPAPAVDFDRCLLVAIFKGVSVNCYGERVALVVERDNT